MIIILIGFKNSGKTTLGKLLAERLEYPFLDTDALIIERYNKNNPEQTASCDIYDVIGKQAFRDLEQAVVQSLMDTIKHANAIVAVGGGTVARDNSVAVLKTLGPLVYIENDKQVIKQRLEKQEQPPAFMRDKDKNFDELYDERIRIYEKNRGLYNSLR